MVTASDFNCYVPCDLLKADASGEAAPFPRRVNGIGSTERLDLQDETLIQRGMDIDYFKAEGWISDEHDTLIRDGNGNVVNKIAAANIGVPVPDQCMVTKAGLWIAADMLPAAETPHAGDCRCPPCRSEWWVQFMKSLAALAKSGGTVRKAGFSVDGKVQRRNGGTILKCWIQRVALTGSPIGRGTYAEMAKSLASSPWCEIPANADEPTCKCTGCGIGAEATRKSVMDGLTFEQAVQHITTTHGWRQESAAAFAGSLYGRRAEHAH